MQSHTQIDTRPQKRLSDKWITVYPVCRLPCVTLVLSIIASCQHAPTRPSTLNGCSGAVPLPHVWKLPCHCKLYVDFPIHACPSRRQWAVTRRLHVARARRYCCRRHVTTNKSCRQHCNQFSSENLHNCLRYREHGCTNVCAREQANGVESSMDCCSHMLVSP